MYDHVYDEMVNAGVAKNLVEPVWIDMEGTIVDREYAYGEKWTHIPTHPHMCFVSDEVGRNISMRGDGHIGGEKLICERGMTPYKKISVKERHFTVLGITLLTGEALMCVLIISGKFPSAEIETGIDICAVDIFETTDEDDLVKNTGPGKRFPCGPIFHVNGKPIPCMVS